MHLPLGPTSRLRLGPGENSACVYAYKYIEVGYILKSKYYINTGVAIYI